MFDDNNDFMNQFSRQGYVLLKNFYDLEKDIKPIQETARQIIAHIAAKYRIDAPCASWEQASSEGVMALMSHDRKIVAQVYDAVKHIPALGLLVYKSANQHLMSKLRTKALAGVAYDGYGIRIDFPAEEKFRAFWHQEFPAQQRSLDGLVFWTPLVPVFDELGPVQIAPGSHQEGPILPVHDSGGVGRVGAYSMRLPDEKNLIAKYEVIAPLTNPGDLLVMDYLTLHQSGYNISNRPRWSVQFRLFNFDNPVGIKTGWARSSEPTGELFEIAAADFKHGSGER